MRIRSILPVFVAVLVAVVFTTDAMAMYHPGLGRFMQRDPHGTAISPHFNRVNGKAVTNTRGFIEREKYQEDYHLQYADGMNLYQYVQSNPLHGKDPFGLFTEAEARDAVASQIQAWQGQGWTLAANLLQHFLDKKGPTEYSYTEADRSHVDSHSHSLVRDSINGEIIARNFRRSRSGSNGTTVSIAPSSNSANRRWWPKSAMWAAYGGVQLRVQGVARPIENSRQLNRLWSGIFHVSLRDFYNFKDYPIETEEYKAAKYLQNNCGYKPFWHSISWSKRYVGPGGSS